MCAIHGQVNKATASPPLTLTFYLLLSLVCEGLVETLTGMQMNALRPPDLWATGATARGEDDFLHLQEECQKERKSRGEPLTVHLSFKVGECSLLFASSARSSSCLTATLKLDTI